jgi:hypothetical protein
MEALTAIYNVICSGGGLTGLAIAIPTIIGIMSIIARATPSESDNKLIDVVSQVSSLLGLNPTKAGSGGVLGNKARE